jgi:NAD-dependent deacetylase
MNCIKTVRELLANAQRVVAFTGAGISVESGVPTFRGPGGLWRTYSAQDLATPEAFARDPKLVWEWYDWRRRQMAEAQPNAGHHALVAMEQRISGFTLVTQNVDGLHDQAGSRNIVKLHGDIWMVRCTGCGRGRQDRQAPLPELPPLCECGAMLRPGVVWFGELLPPGVWSKAEHAASRAEVFLTIGTSALVHPAAGLIDVARMGAAKTVEINPDATPYSGVVDYAIRGSAAEVLPQLVAHNTD